MELIKPTVIARRALAMLYNTTLLAGLVYRDYDQEFAGKVGDTVNVRKPATFQAKEFDRATGIELQDPRETSFPVVLDTILDVSFPVTTEEMTLTIDNFAERLLNPAMEAIVQDIDSRLATELLIASAGGATRPATAAAATNVVTSTQHRYSNGDKVELTAKTGGTGLLTATGYFVRDATADTFKLAATPQGAEIDITTDMTAGTIREVGGGTATGATPNAAFRKAREILSRNRIPTLGRSALLSPEATSDATGDEVFLHADKSGSTDALREANIGRVFGFDTYEAQGIGPAETPPRDADGVAFHRDSVALVTRTLEKPMGVAPNQVAIESYKGLGLRVVYAYDTDKKQDVVSVDFLLGVETVRPGGAVKLDIPDA
jgi:hypothetical protein